MRDQYVGDIGDHIKYGLLRALEPKKLGVIWYKIVGDQQGADGRHTGYLHEPETYRDFDENLFDALRRMVCSENCRSIAKVENKNILPAGTVFFSKSVPFNAKERVQWFCRAFNNVAACDIIFIDPDNGLHEEKTASEKHVSWVKSKNYRNALR